MNFDYDWLPMVFAAIMGLSILLYVILDGYDLGVGMLMALAPKEEKDRMIASIGPFWDANETWLVFAVGILLVAFPSSHGYVLTALYIPATIMLIALILRGVSSDFRAKARSSHKALWDSCFVIGSAVAALTQGYMLGQYIMGFENNTETLVFSLLTAVAVAAGYALIGACWLIMKTEGMLQARAVRLARPLVWLTAAGIALISLATPYVSERIFERWVSQPEVWYLMPIPVLTALSILALHRLLKVMPLPDDRYYRRPFQLTAMLFVLCFVGLAYSFYPYTVPGVMTLYDSAASRDSLLIMFYGAAFVLPVIAGYTVFAYRVFHGKARDLTYD